MKGTPRPTWSEGRQRWLRKLKGGAAKPKGTGEGSTATYCRALGWTAIDTERRGHVLTAEGMATLARWEAGDTKPPGVTPQPTRTTFARLLQHEPAELATRLLDMGEQHARAVYEALHTALFGTAPNPANVLRGIAEHVAAQAGLEVDHASFDQAAEVLDAPVVAAIDAQAVRAPQYFRHDLKPSLGHRTTPKDFSECLQCRGRGVVSFNFQCPACHGAGTIRRTVQL